MAPEIGLPFSFHWYAGFDPALETVEEKVRLSPKHIVLPGLTFIETVGMVRALTEIEGIMLEQPVADSLYVKVTVPGATPVTTPALVTVAKLLLLLVQVPPLFGDRVIVLPTQTLFADTETAGRGFTVICPVVLEHPVAA